MKSVEIRNKNIIATVDYRTELLGILMWLSGYTKILPECFSIYENKFYIDNIIEKFSKYKSEDDIENFELRSDTFSYYDGWHYDYLAGDFYLTFAEKIDDKIFVKFHVDDHERNTILIEYEDNVKMVGEKKFKEIFKSANHIIISKTKNMSKS